ncbi:MAG: CFI-box-CTERM domain-containing protein [Candidatus Bathyarchaeia archaeon]
MKILKTLTFLTLLPAFLIYSVLTQGLLSAPSLLIIFNIPVLWLIFFKKNKFKTILPKAAIISVMLSLIILSNFKPAYPYTISEISLPQIQYGVESRPLNIIVGEDGNLYFTEQYSGKIGQLNPSSNEIKEWIIPSTLPTSEPWDLNYTSGGEIFFTDYRQNKIIKLTLSSNQIMQWDIPTPNSGPRGIFVKSSNEIWFTEFLAGKIARLDSGSNKFYEYSLPSGSQPNDIIVVGDKVWVTDFGRDKITCLDLKDPNKPEIIEYSLPSGSKPYGITVDPDGMIWFTLYGRNMIGKLNPWNREVTEYKPIPTANSQPTGITIDKATGNIWFTESAGHKIGKYVPGENMFYEYPTLTSSSTPMGITLYRDSNNKLHVWFTEWAANKLGEIIEGENTGPTTTITTSRLTTAATGKYSVATSKSSPQIKEDAKDPSASGAQVNPPGDVIIAITTLTNTVFKLSTSTMATSMNYITEVMHTSVTVTLTSTTYVSTISLTTTTTSTSYFTSYTGTSLITYTTTLYETVYTSTMSLTSSTTETLPYTLRTTVWFTNYRSTIPATTFTTYKSTVYSTNVYTVYSTSTLTVTTTNITVSPTVTLPINVSCFIASAAYDSSLAKPVQVLRSFRDNLVLKTFAGENFMKVFNAWYYSFSPEIASFISRSPILKLLTRFFIYPLIGILTLASLAYHVFAFNPELAVVMAGIVASGFIGIVYFTPITLLVIYPLKHKAFKNKRKILTYVFTFWLISFPMLSIAETFKAELLMKIASSMLVLTTIMLSTIGLSFILLKFIKKHLKLNYF